MTSADELNLQNYRRIVFFTGAGLSAESGIPTYRGEGGIWGKYDYKQYACQRAFLRNPEKVWDFHDERRIFISKCHPSEGHRIIAAIEREKPGTTVITQNIDGLHSRAGSRNVIELHGSLWRVRCDEEKTVFTNDEIPIKGRRCSCGRYLRPDIVWFEDPLRETEVMNAINAIMQCDVFISIGTSGVVYPAAQMPIYAIQRGAVCIEINMERTPLTELYSFHLEGSAGEILKRMWPGRA